MHLLFLLLLALVSTGPALAEPTEAERIALGKLVFFDKTLSSPEGQACASCHIQEKHYADPGRMISPGANPALFGNRNAPSIAYAKFTPELHWNAADETWVGGFFLDGRARTMTEQAKGPFLNPLEMGNATAAEVVAKVRKAPYAKLFETIYGEDVWSDTTYAFDAIADAIVTYENGPEFALFTSKYDAYLKGKVQLTALEKKGLEIFEAEDKGNCAACHPSTVGKNGEQPLFTDFTYDNLGSAHNDRSPFLLMAKEFNPAGTAYVDEGLALNPSINSMPFNNAAAERGKFKVPTLRNVAETGPYLHDGSLDSLRDVVEFYNTRDTDKKWGKPEIADNVNKDELGDLKLSDAEIDALVAFLKTLTDGFVIPGT